MVSVCLASYNGEKYIHEQIMSILIQLAPDDELIISDDHSRDQTALIIQGIDDPRIRLYKNTKPSGPITNFQNALEKVRGAFVFLADQDDVWLPGKYRHMLELLQSYDLILSDSVVVDEHKEVINPSFYAMHGSAPGILKNVAKSSYFGSCMAFRREILRYSLPFPPTKEIGHDLWLGLVAELTGKVYFSKEALILYRRHASTVTSVGMGKSSRSLITKIFGRVTIIKYLIKFYIKYLLNGKRFSVNNNPHV
jgi:glycosyltransferase involved in cell wall biosynthesis